MPGIENRGVVIFISQVREKRRAIRVNMARPSPMIRAFAPLMAGQPVGKDRNEDDVVDTKHNFQSGQGNQCRPNLGVE